MTVRGNAFEVVEAGQISERFENERLAALDRLEILDTPAEPLFDSLAELAARTFNMPIALISLVDRQRQWFKAGVGIDVAQTPRNISFCQEAILSDDVLVIPDAAEDVRFCENPLVTGSPDIRFYAGAPLITPEGHRLGTICVIDIVARKFTEADASRLQAIAESIMQAMRLRLDSRERERITSVITQQSKLLKLAEDMAGVGTWSWDVAADRTIWSDQVYHIHGYEPGVEAPPLSGVLDRYHPDDATLLADRIRRAVAEGLDYALEARIYRPDGSERHVTARGACRKDANGSVIALVGTFQDITDHVARTKFIRSLTDNLPGPVGYWDADLRCRFANAAYKEWFGQSAETVLTLSLPQLLGAEMFAKSAHHVRAVLGGQNQTFLRTLVKPSGEICHTQTHYIADTDASGRTQGFYVLVSDFTALKQAEDSRAEAHDELQEKTNALRETNRLLLMAEELSGAGHWRLDTVHNRVFWSDVVCAIHGRPPGYVPTLEEAIDAYHPDDRAAVSEHVDQAIASGKGWAFEARLALHDGTVRQIASHGRIDTGPDDAVIGVFGIFQDITESKRQQQALIQSEETFRRALENAVVGNALVAPDGTWLKVNRALCTLVGFGEAELLRGGTDLIQDPGEPWVLRETVEALLSGASAVVESERRLRHRDGHILWVNVCASLVARSGGVTDYLVVQFQDLTERKRAEIIKDEFVSTVNHELRTPLTSIFGSLRLLGATTAGKLDPKSQRLLEVAQISCTQLTGLVNDILDIEKIAAGKMDYQMATLAAAPLIQDIVNRHGTIADLHGVTFNTRLDVEGLAIRVDPNRFNQALVNLLSNAAKYSTSGDQVDIVAKRTGGATIRISVTDHGPGIPQAFRPRIFGRFAQADNSATRRVGGSGLGLNITKTLIEAFGGTVSFDSVEGLGATFHFVLPACKILATELEPQAHG